MIVALHDNKLIALQVFAGDKPGLFGVVGFTSDAKTLSLAECVVHQTGMLTQQLPIYTANFTRLGRQIPAEEFREWTFADEADTGTILLVVRR
jgi:predicted alpha/beta hydrolase